MALPTFHQDLDVSMANAPEEVREFVRQREFEKGQSFMPSRPKVGLLSHTVVPSPTIQWVLPAHLRSQRHNDVVFVGDRHLQIREAVSGIHLEDVTTKSDFDAQIMAAKVINVSTELPWEAQMKLGSGNVCTNADPDAQDDLPPQILVLSLASRELVFLYYSTSEGGRFIHYRRPLPNDVNLFEQFGRNVSVEPRSRAIAVSASCDYFGIFMLEEPHILRSQMTRNQFSPILEERFFRVDGDILSMEFLHPKSEEENRIILLLLVAKNQLTHAICYEWNANILIRNATPRVTKRLLPFEDRLPTMVIPLTKTSSFMLVATGSVSVYRNRLDPRTQPIRYPLPCDKQNQRSPLWTRWARPLRNWVYNQKHDDIYLCREDGQIFYLEIGNEGDIENQTFLGLLHCDVDAAFDTLDIGHEGGDLLLVAGTTGDGGLFVQKARDHPRCVQRFMNWTPVTDSVVVQSTGDDSLESVSSDRLFTCSPSNYGKGAITELRYGIEAQIGLAISLEGLSSTKDIWTITDRISGGFFILTSDPVSTLLIYLPADFGEEICAIDEADSGLGFSSQTLAASCTQSGAIIQVTERAVHLRDVSGPLSGCRFDYDPTENVVAAAVHDSAALIATAIRSSQGAKLHLLKISSTDNQLELSGIGERVNIDYDPVSISVERLGLSLFVFIGTGDGKVLIYRVVERGFTFVTELNLNLGKSDDISKAIESMTVVNVTAQGSLDKSILFCGLRSGILLSFGVTVASASPDSDIDIKQGVPQQLGHTSVRVQSKGSTALLTCGEGFWQALCVSGETPECILERVWITDQKNPAFYPKSISGFTTSNVVDPDADDSFNSLFCIADEQLFICTLDRSARTVPRRINLPGSATKLAYSKHLRSLIVAYSQTNLDTTSDPVKRFTRPMVEFVDPDFQDQEIELPASDEISQPWRPHGAAGEKITCILEWTPRKGDEEYHLIVIGTSRKDQEERGRVIFLQTARNAENPSHIDCSVKYVHKFEGPVYSITPYGPFTLMVSSGRDIVPLEPKFSRTRWGRASRFSAVSPAISMTVHEPYLYMSTARESLMVLKASDDKLTLHAYDRHKHDGISHVHIGGELNLTLASSRGGTISVLTENGVTEANKMMPAALCEAHLPLSVMKLSLGSKPSSLSSSSQVIYGNTINGTTYRFLTLNEKEWRLMRLLQNICAKDPGICPFTSKRKRQRNPVESESVDGPPSRMHINGDILSRLVARGADYLHKMLASEDLYDSSSPETGTVPATLEQFSVLSADVLGTSADPVEEVMKWLRNALHMQF